MSIQAVLHTNNATVGAQNKENKMFKIEKAFKQKSETFHCYLKKEGGRRWIKQQIRQLNTMQQNWKRSYSNYTQPVKSASHHQRRANQQASYAARDQSKQNKTKKKRFGRPPNRIRIIQKKKEEEEEKTETEQCKRSQSTRKHTDMRWSTEWTTHPNANLLMNSNDSNIAHTHARTPRKHTHKLAHLTILLKLWISLCTIKHRNEEWSKSEYTDKEVKEDGGHHHSSKKIKQRKTKTWNKTMVVKHCQAFQIRITHQRDLEKHMTTNTHHQVPNWSKEEKTPLSRKTMNKERAVVQFGSFAWFGWQLLCHFASLLNWEVSIKW